MKEIYDKEGKIVERTQTEKEVEFKENSYVKHSLIWAIVIIVVAMFIYIMIRYGKCGC
jgi:preprotein translocase subunit SecF